MLATFLSRLRPPSDNAGCSGPRQGRPLKSTIHGRVQPEQEIYQSALYRRGMDELTPLAAMGSGPAGESDDWRVGDWFTPRPSRPLHSVRCDSISTSTGMRCRKWSVIGFTKCSKHSGVRQLTNLAEYRQKMIEFARLQLLEASGDAVETLIRIRDDEDAPQAVRLKAASEILDRAGVHRGADVTISTPAPPAESPAEIIRARLDRLAAAGRAERLELESARTEAEDDAARTN